MTYISSAPFLDTAFDLTTLSFITVLLVLCILSLCFIFYLRFKSRSSLHLQSFNSLWTVRFLLVLFITLWALNELIRIPTFRRRYLRTIFSPSFSNIKADQESTLCKLSVVLSLGLFQPAFLVTLLFLVDVSIKKHTPTSLWAIGYIFSMCVPILCLQSLIVFSSYDFRFWPRCFRRSGFVVVDRSAVLCSYPLLSTIVFGAFGIAYSFWFLISCWKVVSMVINKALRVRIYGLAAAVLVSLPAQIAFLALSVVWDPDEPLYGFVALLVFLSAFVCAVVGQGILVIRPIADSLSAGADFGSRCCVNIGGGRGRRRVNA